MEITFPSNLVQRCIVLALLPASSPDPFSQPPQLLFLLLWDTRKDFEAGTSKGRGKDRQGRAGESSSPEGGGVFAPLAAGRVSVHPCVPAAASRGQRWREVAQAGRAC